MKLIESDFENVDYNFYFARSAFFLKNFGEAISAYERLLIKHPNNTRSKLELARIYFILKNFSYSKRYFEEVLLTPLPETVKANVQRYLAIMKKENSISSLTGMAFVGMAYDSNIYSVTDKENWYVPVLGVEIHNSEIPVAGVIQQSLFSFTHILNTEDSLGFVIKNSFMTYFKNYLDYGGLNINYLSYTPKLSWKFSRLMVDLGLGADTMMFDSEHYLDINSIIGKIAYTPASNNIYSLEYKNRQKEFAQISAAYRNSTMNEFLLAYINRTSPRSSWYVKENIIIERKNEGSYTNIDLDSFETLLGKSNQFGNGYQLDYNIGFRQVDYRDDDLIYLTKRSDVVMSANIALQKRVSKSWTIQSTAGIIEYDSNFDSSDYEKLTVSLNAIYQF